MTVNQLQYWTLQEQKRANRANEQETRRSNRAREFETQRHNVRSEQIDTDRNIEQKRSNQAQEVLKRDAQDETQRANLRKEELDEYKTTLGEYSDLMQAYSRDYTSFQNALLNSGEISLGLKGFKMGFNPRTLSGDKREGFSDDATASILNWEDILGAVGQQFPESLDFSLQPGSAAPDPNSMIEILRRNNQGSAFMDYLHNQFYNNSKIKRKGE